MNDKSTELVDMQEAIALLKTTRTTLYRWLREGKLKGMKAGRQWRFRRVDLEGFMRGEEPRVELTADITPLLDVLCKGLCETGMSAGEIVESGDRVADAVNWMIQLCFLSRASDLHLDTFEDDGTLRFRIDGCLKEVARIDLRLMPALLRRWKMMAACDVSETRKPQDGRIKLRRNGKDTKSGRHLDLRVSFLPNAVGEGCTVRLLDRAAVMLTLDQIDYAEHDAQRIRDAVRAPWGLVFITGPTGSGKTTTLYCCLNEANRPEVKVMSVEDPVEFLIPGVVQVPVRAQEGITFSRVARSMLRSDPDVIMIGEIRDFETLQVAQQAALTGHLVMSTLHTNDAPSALMRLLDMGSSPFVTADAVKLILAQRLVRTLCKHCSREAQPEPQRLDAAAEVMRRCGQSWNALSTNFREAVGCEKCSRVGYRGRTVVSETLVITPEIGRALRDGASLEELRAIAIGQGMTPMTADGVRRAALGQTSLAEVVRVAGLTMP